MTLLFWAGLALFLVTSALGLHALVRWWTEREEDSYASWRDAS